MFTEYAIPTQKREELISVTELVREAVVKSEIKDGAVLIQVPHTTAGVTINESADPDVARDILKLLKNVVPDRMDYFHLEGNSPAHIKASLVGCSAMIIVKGGELMLGTWQGVFFCEFDGPRSRRLWVKTL